MMITIDGRRIDTPAGTTILDAAAGAGIYIPALCRHPDLDGLPAEPGFAGCDLCVVEIEGRADPAHACWMTTEPGLVVRTETPSLRERRRAAFARILDGHPHACLTCRQKSGCAREPCSLNVPVGERCCPKLGRCVIEKLHDYLQFSSPVPLFRRDDRLTQKSALFAFDWNLCVGCLRCVRACNGLRQVGALGAVRNDGRFRAAFRAATPEESGCRFCGTCAEVCPTGAILDRVRHEVACRRACPAGLDVPSYVRAIAQGKTDVAARIIRAAVPFGRVLGRVCHAPCEAACRRGAIDEAVSICALKRFACDTVPPEPPERAPATGRRVGIVGAGPAGLSAAWFLARKGHAVTVLEEQPEAGGMLRWAIPAERLPADVVADEVAGISRLGVEIRTSTRVKDLATLRRQFDAVLVATGLPCGRRLNVPGVDQEGVWNGLDFLRTARSGLAPRMGDRMLVIGGGNVAMDCALTAREMGARDVTVVCLEAEGQMPAFAWEMRRAREVGVRIMNAWGPVRIGTDKRTTFRRCVSVFDANGRFAPRFDDAQQMSLEANGVIAAIGQQADDSVRAAPEFFAAGDVGGGPFSVINAIASGKAAAARIDVSFGGDGLLPDPEIPARPAALGAGSGDASRCLQCDLRLTLRTPAMPPAEADLREVSAARAQEAPAKEGVLKLFGADRVLLQITGTANLREELGKYVSNERTRYFAFELDPYYTKRESELLQAYLQEHGRLPEGVENLDDLY
ncbi:MAG: FAD-dependent oxidoreductase [Planctomycetes bacterium]|nr:FAD-dependent oxidoreductase [Planctomycetota bacterium]